MMSNILLIAILAGTAAVLPMAMWLGFRLYALIGAITRCRACGRTVSEEERRRRCPMPTNVLAEFERAGGNMRFALMAVLVLLIVLWLFGTWEAQRAAVKGIGIGALVCCAVFVVARLTMLAASLLIPASASCRATQLEAMKKNGRGSGWMTVLYALVHLLLSSAM